MNEQYVSKCNKIFEGTCENQEIEKALVKFQQCFAFEVSKEYQYILERYAGVYLRDNYGFKSLEKTPLTDKNGFNIISRFFGLIGKKNIFEIYEIYKQQLPIDLIPIGELDGGNLLCINRVTNDIYIWIHDTEQENMYLAQNSILDLICSFEQLVCETDTDLGIMETNFSPSFLDALRNYKK